MSDKIKPIRPDIKMTSEEEETLEPDTEVVEVLKTLLGYAESGVLRELSVTAGFSNKEANSTCVGDCENPDGMMGQMFGNLQAYTMNEMTIVMGMDE